MATRVNVRQRKARDEPRSCGIQSAHQSLINRRLNAAASCNRQHIMLSALKSEAKTYVVTLENGHENHKSSQTGIPNPVNSDML